MSDPKFGDVYRSRSHPDFKLMVIGPPTSVPDEFTIEESDRECVVVAEDAKYYPLGRIATWTLFHWERVDE